MTSARPPHDDPAPADPPRPGGARDPAVPASPDDASVPSVVVAERRRGVSIVWIIPVLAGLLAGWIWLRALAERGPTITIHFETAEGLEADKTLIKHRDVELGTVLAIHLLEDLSGVSVTAELMPEIEPYLRDSTRFWVVRPRVGAGGVSGLDTLLSGAYIEIEPGTHGESRRHFDGLELPPVAPADAPGVVVILRADELGSLSIGSGVTFRNVRIGRVQRHRLDGDGQGVEIEVYIDAEYCDLIREHTIFWNASGISASLSAAGVKVRTESIEALLTGGIAAETPPGEGGARVENGHVFTLYTDHAAAHDTYARGDTYVMYFDGSVRGLSPGAPVEFRGIQIGEVIEITASFDNEAFEFHIPVYVDIQPDRIQRMGNPDADRRLVVEGLVERGLRAQLAPGNLVTGALYVDLDFHPESEPQRRARADDPPEIPTIPSTVDQLQATVRELPQIAREARDAVRGIERLINSPETRSALTSLRDAAEGARDLVASIDARAPELIDGVERTLASIEESLDQAQRALGGLEGATADGADLRRRVDDALADMSAAARALRQLAETLERQPEALLKGKSP